MNDPDDRRRLVALGVNRERPPPGPGRTVPEGKLEMVITYLEMRTPPKRVPASHPAAPHAILRAQPPTVSFYRYLYNHVGARWLWYERRLWDDARLLEVLEHPQIEIYVLYVRGTPAGFVELDRRITGECELAYLGLLPEFLGQGFGRYLLDWAVDTAWLGEAERVWVHTCNWDHPRAFGLYQRAGFEPYEQVTRIIDDPRLTGVIPVEGAAGSE